MGHRVISFLVPSQFWIVIFQDVSVGIATFAAAVSGIEIVSTTLGTAAVLMEEASVSFQSSCSSTDMVAGLSVSIVAV